MRPLRSLSSRLIGYWIVGSALAFFVLPVAIRISIAALGLGEFRDENLESWTTKRARYVVQAALREAPDGHKFIEQTAELRGYMRRNPEFRFAAIDAGAGAVLPGSSEELATAFAPSTRVDMLTISFHMADDPNPNARGWVRTIGTAIGDVRFVLYGAYFQPEDLFYNLSYTLTIRNFFVYLPFCGVLTLIAFIVVRRGLAPLRAAAGAAADIDVNSLKERIPSADLPSEIAPFVEAVNNALARVDEGVARQRRFLANAAHELRTPITILCAHIANPDDATFRRDMKRDARRIRTIVEQLLSMAHVDNQRDSVDCETDLGSVALSVILNYMPLAIENGRNIELEQPPSPVIARANRWAVESILTNLIENAVRAEPKGGTVQVRVHRDARIEVSDHGDGVDPEDRDAVFEPFWRKNSVTRGAGLGLAVARELMDKLDGRIWVEETSGGGATFKISFRSGVFGAPLSNAKVPARLRPTASDRT